MDLDVTFIVVDDPTSYSAILERSTLNPNKMVHSTYHQLLKFQTPHGIRVVKGDQPATRSCYVQTMRHHVLKKETLAIQMEEDPREEKSRPQPIEGLKKVEVDGPGKDVQIRASLQVEEAKSLPVGWKKPPPGPKI